MVAISPPISSIVINGNTYLHADWEANPTGTLSAVANDIAAVAAAFSAPNFVTPPLNLFISKLGSDANDGRVSGSPCLTISKALDTAFLYHVRGGNVYLNFQGAGVWAESVDVAGLLTGNAAKESIGQIVVNGNGAANTTIGGNPAKAGTVIVSGYAVVAVQNVTLTANAAGQSCLYANLGGTINVQSGVVFGNAEGHHMITENTGSQIELWDDLTITGDAGGCFALANSGSLIQFNPVGTPVITLTSVPDFGTAFFGAQYNGTIVFYTGWSTTGTATGRKLIADQNGIIYNATGVAALPGDEIGLCSRGGRYFPSTVPTLSDITGLGTGGTATVITGSGSHAGFIELTTGTGTMYLTGNVGVYFQNTMVGLSNALPGPYLVSPVPGVNGWGPGASAMVSAYTDGNILITWNNPSSVLTASTTYRLSYLSDSAG